MFGKSAISTPIPLFEYSFTLFIDCIVTICLIVKGELLESTTVGDMAHKPAYFVPGNLLIL